ncbi:hypothetical protein FCULG_00009071, partial [Fusarium culmorum]
TLKCNKQSENMQLNLRYNPYLYAALLYLSPFINMLFSTIILAFPLAVASWPHIEACRKAWPAEPCAYIAGNAMVLGTCESVCETTNCPNNVVCKPRRWTRHCDNCGGDLNTGGNRGSTHGTDHGPTIL